VLFQLADAPVLPLLSQNIGEAGNSALLITGLIVTAQLIVVFLAPWVGCLSEAYGRKPLLMWGFGLESVRSVLLSTTTNYGFLLVGQLLGGLASAIVEVLIIVIITDVTAGTGRFNLVGGTVTMLMGAAGNKCCSERIHFPYGGSYTCFFDFWRFGWNGNDLSVVISA
jgi:MFS family permease